MYKKLVCFVLIISFLIQRDFLVNAQSNKVDIMNNVGVMFDNELNVSRDRNNANIKKINDLIISNVNKKISIKVGKLEQIKKIKVENKKLYRGIPKPDLWVYNVKEASAYPFKVGQDVSIKFTVANIGDFASESFKISIKINESLIGIFTLEGLSKMTQRTYTVTIPANMVLIPEGIATVRFIADENNDIPEQNESNNEGNKNFKWIGGLV